MKKSYFLVLINAFILNINAQPKSNYNLLIAPATLSDKEVTLLWDKQYPKENAVYEIVLNGKLLGTTEKTNFTISKLKPATAYSVLIRLRNNQSSSSTLLKFKTKAKS